MDKLKRALRSAVLVGTAVIMGTASVDAKTLSQLMNESQSVRNRISANQAQLNSAQSTKAAAMSDLQVLDNQLETVRGELVTLNGKLAATTIKLQKSQQELDEAVAKKEAQHDTLLKRIRIMYENGSSGYMDALFESENFTDFFKRLEYANRIMDYDRKLLLSYQAAEEIIAENVETITNEKLNIEKLQNQQLAKQQELSTAVETKRAFIEKMDSDSAVYAENIRNLQSQDADVQRLIQQTQAIAAAAQRQSESTQGSRNVYVPSYTYTPTYSGGSSYTGGGTAYTPPRSSSASGSASSAAASTPQIDQVPGTTTTYDNEDAAAFGYDDAGAAVSSDVVAAADGTVIYAGNKEGYGKCVIIDHGDGYSTVYANNNYIDVSLGQSVQRGEIIGGAGDSGYSSGTYSGFEAKIGGQHSNVDSYINE